MNIAEPNLFRNLTMRQCVGKRRFVTPVVLGIFALGLTVLGVTAQSISPAQVRQIAASLPAQPTGLGLPATERNDWQVWAQSPALANVVAEAEALLRQPPPALTDDLYLDFSRTGNRNRAEAVVSQRRERLKTFTLAECVENRGRFLSALAYEIELLCGERTWVLPAHDRNLDNFHGRTVEIDLRSSAVAWDLATVHYLLRGQLRPATLRLIELSVRQRVFEPYRDMIEGRRPAQFWLTATHNWNAVCLAGVTGAALALEEAPADRAWFVAAAQKHIPRFLAGFTPDGYCSEGLGYWNYGFGHFLMLGETMRQATEGKVDLLADPKALAPALFATHSEILNGVYLSVSDATPGTRPVTQFQDYIYARFDLGEYSGNAPERTRRFDSVAGAMWVLSLPEALPVAQTVPALERQPWRTWFSEAGVLIARPGPESDAAFAVALKGGHNAEHHNHNDVGSFSVVMGKTMVLCDPGAEVYTARTFGARRYDSQVLNSHGHAVPRVGGQLQRPGAEARAVVVQTNFTDTVDSLTLDLTSAYAVKELQQLQRTFIYRRAKPASLTVRDEVRFTSPKTFETALITWGDCQQIAPQELLIRDGAEAVLVKVDTGGRAFRIRSEVITENVRTARQPQRIAIVLNAPVMEATVTLWIGPR